MLATESSFKQILTREAALFLGLFFAGFVLMPIAIYLLGGKLLGDYGGSGYGEFFGTLSGRIRGGDRVAWLLVISPYLAVMILRLMAWGWRRTARN